VFYEEAVLSAVSEDKDRVYAFGPFILNAAERLLMRDGETVPLAPRVFDTLVVLIERHGSLLTKDDLLSQLWPDTFVEEGTLTRNISDLRKALSEVPGGERYIETVPRHGYRFVAPVKRIAAERAALVAEENSEHQDTAGAYDDAGSGDNSSEKGNPVGANSGAGNRFPAENGVIPDLVPSNKGGAIAELPADRRHQLVYVRPAILAVALLLIASAAVIVYRHFAASAADPSQPIRSIAVLPLENLSDDPAQEYFADGMTEALISSLARIRALKVISRTSVMRYKGTRKSLPEIAKELNVDAVIEGTIQRSGGRVRVTAQLIRAATDTHIWANNYERDLTDVLKLQSDVARAVADEIRIQVTAEERERLASARSVDPQAHEAYLLGRYYFSKGNPTGWKQAIENFERAISLAPDYAAAYAGLSDTWLNRGIFELNFKTTDASARAAALKAVGFDEHLAEAHISLGNIKFNYDWDWAGAETEFSRAIELDPGSLRAHSDYGYLLMAVGRHDEAIREGRIAAQLDPLSSETQSALGRFYYRARRVDEAVPHLERAVELEPASIGARFKLGEAYIQQGKYEEAIRAFKDDRLGISRAYALTGKQREARQMVRTLKEPPISIAAVYAALGDKDEAFRILEKAVDDRSAHLVYLKEDPPLRPLHDDPRWKALLRRMNLPPE
jgi:TolB-like protein/DNA-binding winged helix-turn-helix (wHTH) protein/Tfp pilus assembly protein PilF